MKSFAKYKWLLIALAVPTGGAVGISLAFGVSVLQPKLILPNEPVLLGKVLAGSTVEGRARISNDGLGMISLAVAATSCECTSVELDESELGPWESTWLNVRVKVQQEPGPFEVLVLLESNADNNPAPEIQFRGETYHPIDFDPPQLRFDLVKYETLPLSRAIELRPAHGQSSKMDMLTLSSSNEMFNTTVERSDSKIVMNVTLNSSAPLGPFREKIVLSFENSEYIYPIYGKITGSIEVAPDTILLYPHSGEGSTGIVRFREREGSEIESVTASMRGNAPLVGYEFATDQDAEGWFLKVSASQSGSHGIASQKEFDVLIVVRGKEKPVRARIPVLIVGESE